MSLRSDLERWRCEVLSRLDRTLFEMPPAGGIGEAGARSRQAAAPEKRESA